MYSLYCVAFSSSAVRMVGASFTLMTVRVKFVQAVPWLSSLQLTFTHESPTWALVGVPERFSEVRLKESHAAFVSRPQLRVSLVGSASAAA